MLAHRLAGGPRVNGLAAVGGMNGADFTSGRRHRHSGGTGVVVFAPESCGAEGDRLSFMSRATSGPVTAKIRTYAAVNAPNAGFSPAPRPAITMENSPLDTNAPPARKPPAVSPPARRTAHQPVSTF